MPGLPQYALGGPGPPDVDFDSYEEQVKFFGQVLKIREARDGTRKTKGCSLAAGSHCTCSITEFMTGSGSQICL